MGAALQFAFEFRTVVCCNEHCGISFAMPSRFYDRMLETRAFFYCPRGHSQHFTGETEEAKLKRRLQWAEEREKELRKDLEKEQHRSRGLKAAHSRIKNRIVNGVCPCCNRTFRNLMRHMKTKHPKYKHEEVE